MTDIVVLLVVGHGDLAQWLVTIVVTRSMVLLVALVAFLAVSTNTAPITTTAFIVVVDRWCPFILRFVLLVARISVLVLLLGKSAKRGVINKDEKCCSRKASSMEQRLTFDFSFATAAFNDSSSESSVSFCLLLLLATPPVFDPSWSLPWPPLAELLSLFFRAMVSSRG